MKKSFEVLNVKCGGCANTLKKSLGERFGEIDVNLEVEPRVITLDVEDEQMDELRKALKSLGYPMSDEEMGRFDAFSTNAKSFVSCAIGKMK